MIISSSICSYSVQVDSSGSSGSNILTIIITITAIIIVTHDLLHGHVSHHDHPHHHVRIDVLVIF